MGRIFSRKKLLAIVLVMLNACTSPEEKVKQYLAEADAFYSQGEYVKADISYRNVLQIYGSHVEALYGRARVSERQGDLKKTYQLYSRLIEVAPEHVQGRVVLGKLYLASGQLDMALEQSRAASELAPRDADVLALKAAVRYRLADTEGAIHDAKMALEADSGNIDALLILAAERLAAEDPEAAIDYLERGLEGNEDNVALQVFKIQALDQMKELDRAVNVFRRLIEFYPEDVVFQRALARLYIQNDNIDAAESIYRNLAATETGEVQARLDMVRFLLAYRDAAKAEQQLRAYIDASPDNYDLRFGLAEFYLQSKDLPRARIVYEEVVIRDGNGPDGLTARNQLAVLALAEGDRATADRLVAEVLAADPQDTLGLINRANIQLQARETNAAIANLRTVLKDDPDSSRALLLLARAHIQSGAQELARDYYIRAVQSDSSQVAISLEYALFLIRTQSYEKAEQVLEAVLAKQPGNANALKAMAQVKLSRQDWAAAQEIANRLQSLESERAIADQIQGAALQGLEQYQDSIEAFKRAHNASPAAARPMVSLVRTYLRMGKSNEARSFLTSVLKVDADNVYAHVLMGQLSLLEQDSDAAERAFQAAIAAAPENQAGYSNLVGLYTREGRYEEARTLLEQGLKQNPANLNLKMDLAGLLERVGDWEGAISIYEGILADDPGVDIAANNLASALTDHRSDEESLRRALELAQRFMRSDMPYYQDTLGWVYHRMGRDEDALPLLEDAVKAMPEFPVFRYHLGMSYLNTNQAERARAELEQALTLAQGGFPGMEEAQRALEDLSEGE